MRQSIRGYADAVIDQAATVGALPSTARELTSVRDLIAGSDDLHGALVDPGIPMAARRSVVIDLLESKVGADTLRLLTFAIDQDRAGEVAADVAWLAARVGAATRVATGTGAGGTPATGTPAGGTPATGTPAGGTPVIGAVLGHKAAEERLEGYATAVLQHVQDRNILAAVEDQLFRFLQVVRASEELRDALSSRAIPAEARRKVVVDLLSHKANATTIALAAYATQVGRPRDYEDLLEYLVGRVAFESNLRLAEIRSATDLDDDQKTNLAAALRQAVGHDVEIRVTLDPSVLAGFVATVGDIVIDGSVRHRLELLKERLVMPEATVSNPAGAATSISQPTPTSTTTGDPADG